MKIGRFLLATASRVTDGDTLTLISAGHKRKVRLAGIDAPENKQQWGMESGEALRNKVGNKLVIVVSSKKERYGRDLGYVMLYGFFSVNLWLVFSGNAWVYREYPPKRAGLYMFAESYARFFKKGLWKNPRPVYPAKFRKSKSA